jgi:hypothetical protein
MTTQSGKKKMLSDKIKRKNQENNNNKTFKRMSIIFDIKIKQNQNQMNKIEKKQFKTKKNQ